MSKLQGVSYNQRWKKGWSMGTLLLEGNGRTILDRRIWAQFNALVAIFIKGAIYCTFAVGPMKNIFFFCP